MTLTTNAELKRLLENARTIAVVGYSRKPDRPANTIPHIMQQNGYQVYFVNPTLQSTPEETVYPSLADVPVPIDIVNVFRRAEDVPEVVEAAIKVGARAIWIQLGIVNEAAAQRAQDAGLDVVMDRCIKVEYNRLMR